MTIVLFDFDDDNFEPIIAGEGAKIREKKAVTVNLNWKHVEPFFGIQPTGREGTSIETFVFTIKDGKIVNWSVADASLDLAIYLGTRIPPRAKQASQTNYYWSRT